jgi:hypothetical protein
MAASLKVQTSICNVGDKRSQPCGNAWFVLPVLALSAMVICHVLAFPVSIIRELSDALVEYRFLIEDRYNNFTRQAPMAWIHAMYALDARGGHTRDARKPAGILMNSLRNP